ncbi:hypothetical protein GX48_06779 [Paracoccidioides brasiliensis]|nr:hypothetical protein GX48_06779 [Paracoccidioides brasiliensis]
MASLVDCRVRTATRTTMESRSRDRNVTEVSDCACFQASRETTSTSSIPTNIESRISVLYNVQCQTTNTRGRLKTIMVLYADKEAADGENIDWILSEVSRRNQQEKISASLQSSHL